MPERNIYLDNNATTPLHPEVVKTMTEAMKDFGLPETEEFGVLDYSAGQEALYATIVRKTQQTLQRLDAKAKELTAAPVEKATAYPFGVNAAKEVLEIYAGSASAVEQVGIFF